MAKQATTQPVTISGKGFRKSDGAALYGCTSASEPGRLHLITWEESSNAWECDCIGYSWKHTCSHVRALSAKQQAEHAAKVDLDATVSLTEAGAMALANWRAGEAATVANEAREPEPMTREEGDTLLQNVMHPSDYAELQAQVALRETSGRAGPAAFSLTKVSPAKTPCECLECGRHFSKVITAKTVEVTCPKCHSTDVEISY